MTKSIFVFVVIILFVAGAGLLLVRKSQTVMNDSTPTPSSLETPQASPVSDTDGFTTRQDGLQVKDVKVGTGAEAVAGMVISAHYVGTLSNGTKFDSSYDRGAPFQFVLGAGQVIKGWDLGIVGMRVGGKRRLIIPSQLGYGERGAGNVIPPNATLLFDVELMNVQAR